MSQTVFVWIVAVRVKILTSDMRSEFSSRWATSAGYQPPFSRSEILTVVVCVANVSLCAENKDVQSGWRRAGLRLMREERSALMTWRRLGAALSSLPHSLALSFYLCCPLLPPHLQKCCCNSEFYFPDRPQTAAAHVESKVLQWKVVWWLNKHLPVYLQSRFTKG